LNEAYTGAVPVRNQKGIPGMIDMAGILLCKSDLGQTARELRPTAATLPSSAESILPDVFQSTANRPVQPEAANFE